MKFLLSLLLVLPNALQAKDGHYAFVPYVNYDSTQAWSFGGAFEKESENKNVDTYLIDLEATPKAKIHLHTNYKTHISSEWVMALKADFSNFYDSFYGFGISTKTEDQKKIKQRVIGTQVTILYESSPYFSFGPYIGFNQRIEIPNYQIDNHRFFQDETSLSLGLNLLYDARNSKISPHSGDKHELAIGIVPEGLNNLSDKSTFLQIKIDLRKYFPIYETVLATRFSAGTTIGEASYLYKYRLGGYEYLRGYQTNRFIGNKMAMVQLEERVNLYKEYIAATASWEAGSVTSNFVDKIRTVKGLGLRIAMPPDWTNYLSVNWGFGNDQNNFSMEFNENF